MQPGPVVLFDFVCGKCCRRQHYAREGEPEGVTIAEAKAIGWTEDDASQMWLCPFCSGFAGSIEVTFRERSF